VLLCGSGRLCLALLLELARRSWEEAELAAAALAGQHARSAGADGGEPGLAADSRPSLPAVRPVERIGLLGPRSAELWRDYLHVAPPMVSGQAPEIRVHPAEWQRVLLPELDAMDWASVNQTAVIVTDEVSDAEMHEVQRVARLHPEASIFIRLRPSDSRAVAAFYGLQPFTPGLLVDGEVPEDTWTRIARHWHECFRLSHPLPPGDPRRAGRVPWADLDPFLREDNLQEVRSIMAAAATVGRLWVPAHAVPPGSIIELSEREARQIAEAEHTRWLNRRLAVGLRHEHAVPWTDLPQSFKTAVTHSVEMQIAQLEDIGLLPIVPVGGPPEATTFEHVGIVLATRLEDAHGTSPGPRQASGSIGRWHLATGDGELQTMTDAEFLPSHEPLGDGRWRRAGTVRAWQVSEQAVIRTKEGMATADIGDWVVEAPDGARWPASNEQFRRRFQLRASQDPEHSEATGPRHHNAQPHRPEES
jgi:hypothetical protein